MHITAGHFEQTKLDGLRFFIVVQFPGPLHEHEGNGQAQPIPEARATPEQRDVLFQILSGKHSAEGSLFHIFSLIVATMHDPVFASVEFEFDQDARRACILGPGVLELFSSRSLFPAVNG